ncbi:MAG: argininosuccinate lyase, partial [FCB group bacterium]|jgi:argininosuccinate lyase|nr:argininosuccinate lyase [FCB group bacterium]
LPFRVAHEVIGKIVRHCIETEKRLPELSLEEFQLFSPHFEEDLFPMLAPEAIVARRDNIGGTAPERVRAQLEKAWAEVS